MRSIGRVIIIILLAAVGAGLYLFGTGTTARTDSEGPSEIRRAVDPQVVRVEGEEELDMANVADNATTEDRPAEESSTAEADKAAGEARTAEVQDEPAETAPESAAKQAAPQISAQAEARIITEFSASATDEGFVLRLDGVPSDFTPEWFRLSSPARFVVDLPGNWALKGRNVFRAESDLIKHVVAGAHPDKLRFVVHFENGASVPQGRPVFVHDEDALSVRVPQ